MQNDCILWICNGRYTSGMAAIYVCVVSVKVSQNISMTVIKSLLMMTNTRRFWEQFVRLTGVCFTFRLTLFFKSRGWEVLFLQIFKPWNHSCQNIKWNQSSRDYPIAIKCLTSGLVIHWKWKHLELLINENWILRIFVKYRV